MIKPRVRSVPKCTKNWIFAKKWSKKKKRIRTICWARFKINLTSWTRCKKTTKACNRRKIKIKTKWPKKCKKCNLNWRFLMTICWKRKLSIRGISLWKLRRIISWRNNWRMPCGTRLFCKKLWKIVFKRARTRSLKIAITRFKSWPNRKSCWSIKTNNWRPNWSKWSLKHLLWSRNWSSIIYNSKSASIWSKNNRKISKNNWKTKMTSSKVII